MESLVWKLVESVARFIGGWAIDWYLKYRIRRDIRRGSDGKIGILLARIADDANDSFRTTVYETIRHELGDAVQLTNWPEVQTLGDGHEYDIERRAYEKVQTLLKDRNCDLMISGRVKGRGSGATVLSLRFTVAGADSASPESYKLTETFDLPADFVGRLGAAISGRVLMSITAAIDTSGRLLVPVLRATAERLEPVVRKLAPGFDADARGSLLFNYALVQAIIGEQPGSNDALLQAVALWRAALREYTRERAPPEWAATQHNLGTTLATLGEREKSIARLQEAVDAHRSALLERTRERAPLEWAESQTSLGTALWNLGELESGTARLDEAVDAHRSALLEYTREHAPLDWAMTQTNLGDVLRTLGERESGTARLEEAVAAYRSALEVFQEAHAENDIEIVRPRLAEAQALLDARKRQ